MHTPVDKPSRGHVPTLAVGMDIQPAAGDITVDLLIPGHVPIPEEAVVTMGVTATTMVEKDTMADMAITVATVTMADVGTTAADMVTSAGEVSIWGSMVHLITILAMAPTTTVRATTVLQAITTNGVTGIQVLVIPIEPKTHFEFVLVKWAAS